MALTDAVKTRGNANTEGQTKLDVADTLFHVGELSETPIVTLFGGKIYKSGGQKPEEVPGKIKSEVAEDTEYKVVEKDPLGRTLIVNGAVADTTTTTITFDSSARAKVGDGAYNKRTGEFIKIIAIDAGGTDVTARRNLGSTTYTINDNDVFEIVGFSGRDGGPKASIRQQLASPRTRRTQIFKRSFGISDTLMNLTSEVKNLNYWDEERIQSYVEHKKDIEFSLILNPAADSYVDADSYDVNMSRGIISELEDEGQVLYTGGDWSESKFFGAYSEEAFKYGPMRKILLASSGLRTIINEYARTKVQSRTSDTKFGLTVKELDTGHGYFEIIPWGLPQKFFNDDQAVYGMVIDADRLTKKFIKNRDTKYEEGIQTPGQDSKEAQFISEIGLRVASRKHHLILSPKAGA